MVKIEKEIKRLIKLFIDFFHKAIVIWISIIYYTYYSLSGKRLMLSKRYQLIISSLEELSLLVPGLNILDVGESSPILPIHLRDEYRVSLDVINLDIPHVAAREYRKRGHRIL